MESSCRPLLLCVLIITFLWTQVTAQERTFAVDYTNQTLLKDGKPFNYISGSIHYSRVPNYYWKDRLEKMYAAGLDAIQVYVPWNVHEPSPGVYDFSGQQNVTSFLQIAQDVGLLVILRAGPYICGEWEFGGFPAWIIQKNASIVLRSMDPQYLAAVDTWWGTFLPKIKPLLYVNGGPIIMVQVENEYGSYFTCQKDYLGHLISLARTHLGNEVVLFTTDGSGANFLKCGAHPEAFATVDFGPGNATAGFAPQEEYKKGSPKVNSEYYTGWLDYWSGSHAHTDTATVTATLKDMLDLKASVNMYMFEGGTNFGFMSGADPPFNICPTSYDYDAPLSEAGDITEKFMGIRTLIAKYKPVPPDVPPSTPKFAYGNVTMQFVNDVLDLLPNLSPAGPITSPYPQTMEQVGHFYGFMLYRHVLANSVAGSHLSVPGIRDMGYVLLDGVSVGLLDRNGATELNLVGGKGQTLDIIVENQGRINFGAAIVNNTKGIISNVTLDGNILSQWQMFPLNITNVTTPMQPISKKYPPYKIDLIYANQIFKRDRPSPAPVPTNTPALYQGQFVVPRALSEPRDTYLNMDGWFKGQAYINGFNLGRYWPVRGPQVTLFVPKGVLARYPTPNNITLLELQRSPCSESNTLCHMSFQDYPIINRTAPHNFLT